MASVVLFCASGVAHGLDLSLCISHEGIAIVSFVHNLCGDLQTKNQEQGT